MVTRDVQKTLVEGKSARDVRWGENNSNNQLIIGNYKNCKFHNTNIDVKKSIMYLLCSDIAPVKCLPTQMGMCISPVLPTNLNLPLP